MIAVAVAATALFSACYTLMQHPRLAQLNYARPNSDRCETCHSNEAIWAFHHAPRTPTADGLPGAKWRTFYDIPWWYDAAWLQPSPPSDPGFAPPGETAPDSTAVGLRAGPRQGDRGRRK